MNNKYFNKLKVEPDCLLSFNINDSKKLKDKFNGMSKLKIGDVFYNKETKQYLLFFLADVFNKTSFERAKFSGFCLYNIKRLIIGDDYFREEIKKLYFLSVFIEQHLSENNMTLKQLPPGYNVHYVTNIFSNPEVIEELIDERDSKSLIRTIRLIKSALNELMFFYMKPNKTMTSISFYNILNSHEISKNLKKKIEEDNLEYTLLIESQIFLNSLMISEKNSDKFYLTLNEYGSIDMVNPKFYNGRYNSLNQIFDKTEIVNDYHVFHSMMENKELEDIYKKSFLEFVYESH